MKKGADRKIADKTCDVCGGNAGPILGQRHCRTKECSLGYVMKMVQDRIEIRGECHIWTGCLRQGGVALVSLRRDWPSGKRRDYRVLDLVFGAGNGKPEQSLNRNYKNLCGTYACVRAEHNQLEVTLNLHIGARLPIEPLARYVESRKDVKLDKSTTEILRKLRKGEGTLTVSRVDEICIDRLHCHPAEIYGEEFFTAC